MKKWPPLLRYKKEVSETSLEGMIPKSEAVSACECLAILHNAESQSEDQEHIDSAFLLLWVSLRAKPHNAAAARLSHVHQAQ